MDREAHIEPERGHGNPDPRGLNATRVGTIEQEARESGYHEPPDSPLNREGGGGPRLRDQRHLV